MDILKKVNRDFDQVFLKAINELNDTVNVQANHMKELGNLLKEINDANAEIHKQFIEVFKQSMDQIEFKLDLLSKQIAAMNDDKKKKGIKK